VQRPVTHFPTREVPKLPQPSNRLNSPSCRLFLQTRPSSPRGREREGVSFGLFFGDPISVNLETEPQIIPSLLCSNDAPCRTLFRGFFFLRCPQRSPSITWAKLLSTCLVLNLPFRNSPLSFTLFFKFCYPLPCLESFSVEAVSNSGAPHFLVDLSQMPGVNRFWGLVGQRRVGLGDASRPSSL